MEENIFNKIKAIFLAGLLSFGLVNTNSVKSADLGPFGHSTDLSTVEGIFNGIGCFALGTLLYGSTFRRTF